MNNFQVQAHSTSLGDNINVSQPSVTPIQSSDDHVERFTKAIENTLDTIRQKSICNDNNSQFIHRLTSGKKLPSFSGDPLEWTRFKRDFEISTILGDYSDSENITRLWDTLAGEAREATRALFVAGNNANEIIKSLEMRFGNTRLILDKIIKQIQHLPNVESEGTKLIEFATELRAAVLAIKSFDNHVGYLYSPELANGLINKLPRSMIPNYVRFAATEPPNKTDLEKISDFIYNEAELNIAAGIVSFESSGGTSKNTERSSKQPRVQQKSVHATNVKESSDDNSTTKNETKRKRCIFCGRKNHSINVCRDFVKVSVAQRWKAVKTSRLCYNCLGEGHTRSNCKSESCKHCGRNHHDLLHFYEKENILKPKITITENKVNLSDPQVNDTVLTVVNKSA